jgi:hypothetical protein
MGHICSTKYLTNTVQVAVSASSSNSSVTVKDSDFNATAKAMDSTLLDTSGFGRSFVNETGSSNLNYYYLFTPAGLPTFGGPALALAAKYNLSISHMMSTSDLIESAQAVKQQFFNNVLLSIFSNLVAEDSTTTVLSTRALVTSRLLVVVGFGFSLGALLLLLGAAASLLLLLTNLKKRPLELEHDPNTAAAAALMLHASETSTYFQGLDRAPASKIEQAFKSSRILMKEGSFHIVAGSLPSSRPPSTSSLQRSKGQRIIRQLGLSEADQEGEDWRPIGLRIWTVSLLMLVLAVIMAGLMVIFALSRGPGLYQTALTYQDNLTVAGHSVYALAPFSVLPTLLAAIVKLWWGSFDDTFRRLTPFLSMVRGPQRPANGALLSCITTPILWITAVAIKKRHWFLALVTFGAFTTEVLQVTMSALWTTEPGVLTRSVNLQQTLEIRNVSRAFPDYVQTSMGGRYEAYPVAMDRLYGGTQFYGSWMFRGLVEITSNGSTPPWSIDGWGFPPADLSNITSQVPLAKHGLSDLASGDLGPALNVTFNATGLSGRLECSAIQDANNYYGLVNESDLSAGYKVYYSIPFEGFANSTGDSTPKKGAIGNWLYQGNNLLEYPGSGVGFTIFWVYVDYPTISPTIFSEQPETQAVACTPIFEMANAEITVDVESGNIQHYRLLDAPTNATGAWDDPFTQHYDTLEEIIDRLSDNVTVRYVKPSSVLFLEYY